MFKINDKVQFNCADKKWNIDSNLIGKVVEYRPNDTGLILVELPIDSGWKYDSVTDKNQSLKIRWSGS